MPTKNEVADALYGAMTEALTEPVVVRVVKSLGGIWAPIKDQIDKYGCVFSRDMDLERHRERFPEFSATPAMVAAFKEGMGSVLRRSRSTAALVARDALVRDWDEVDMLHFFHAAVTVHAGRGYYWNQRFKAIAEKMSSPGHIASS